MNDPFAVLDVDEHADDETVRKAYLKLVRTYSPERAPTRFQEIRTAYEQIAERRNRLKYYLFESPRPDLPSLSASLLKGEASIRPNEQKMLAIVTESIRNFRLLVDGGEQ